MPKTEFVHAIDGFAFINSWDMQPADWDQLRGIIQGAATGLSFDPLVSAIISPLLFAIPPGPPISNLILGKIVTDQIVSNVNPGAIGLCGGMACAAADYFQMRWLPPRGEFATGASIRNPGWTGAEEAALRRFIWGRLLDSLISGGVAVQTLVWMGVVHNIFPFSTLGGAAWLRARSRENFASIRASIDAGMVCPIGLIATTPNPMDNHQVLVTGYDSPGPLGRDSCRLYVYEPNGPNAEQTIDFDFSGAHAAVESVAHRAERGDLQGFFTAQYTPRTPAPALVVTSGLSASATTVNVGFSPRLDMTVRNAGFGDTPPLKLFIAGRAGATNVDAGGEAAAARIPMGASRPFSRTPSIAAPLGARHYFASSAVEPAGAHAWRLPADAAGGHTGLDMFVTDVSAGWQTLGGIIRSAPSVVRSRDGRLFAFAIGTDNNLWMNPQSSPSGGFSGWARSTDVAPAGLGGRPFAMSDRDGLLHVFCRGLDRQVWHTRQSTAGGALQGWEGMGGSTPADPTASFNSDGRLEAFIHQNDNTACHRWINPFGWWPSGWESRGGNLLGAPTEVRNADGRLELFARFTDNSLRHQWQTSPGGGWSDWAPFGNGVTSEAGIGVNSDGRLEVFCVSGGTVWQRWQTVPSGGWSAWVDTRQPAAADARVAVATNGFGGIEAFVRAPDNTIWTAGFRPAGWTAWRSLGGTPDGDPAAGMNTDGKAEVFTRGTDGSLQHRRQSAAGVWS